jgi:hypothetical protein
MSHQELNDARNRIIREAVAATGENAVRSGLIPYVVVVSIVDSTGIDVDVGIVEGAGGDSGVGAEMCAEISEVINKHVDRLPGLVLVPKAEGTS